MAEPPKTATVYRMVTPDHVCPFGLKARWLLIRRGYKVDDHPLRTRVQTEAVKERLGVRTTPQIFIGSRRVGGYDELRRYFGLKVRREGEASYTPVLAVFLIAWTLAAAARAGMDEPIYTLGTLQWFVAFSMCILALLKLQDLESFSSMFLNYDLLARRFVPYAYAYPLMEFTAGALMVAGRLPWLAIGLSGFIGTVGAVSVVKAVWIDRRELRCACVGGQSNVPLGAVSLGENLMMVGMAAWMAWHTPFPLALPMALL